MLIAATKAKNPAIDLDKTATSEIVSLYFELSHLKHLYRKGWLERGIPASLCESVAEHTLAVALMAMMIADRYFPDLDMSKVLRIALLHDVGEVDAGDITPADGIGRVAKSKQEEDTIIRLFGQLTEGSQYRELWLEYEKGRSEEALFVRQIEKLEMAFQACVYERQNQGDLSDFYASAARSVSEKILKDLLTELESLRPQKGTS